MTFKISVPDEVRELTWEGHTVRVYVVRGRPYASYRDVCAAVCITVEGRFDFALKECLDTVMVVGDDYNVMDTGMSTEDVIGMCLDYCWAPGFSEWYRREAAAIEERSKA